MLNLYVLNELTRISEDFKLCEDFSLQTSSTKQGLRTFLYFSMSWCSVCIVGWLHFSLCVDFRTAFSTGAGDPGLPGGGIC